MALRMGAAPATLPPFCCPCPQAAQPGVDWGIETIGSHFGEGAIPRSLPGITWPEGLRWGGGLTRAGGGVSCAEDHLAGGTQVGMGLGRVSGTYLLGITGPEGLGWADGKAGHG